MQDPITVLLGDDHAMVRIGLNAFFETLPDIQVSGEAANQAAQLAADVVLMDLIRPGMDGVETTRNIKKASPRTEATDYAWQEGVFRRNET